MQPVLPTPYRAKAGAWHPFLGVTIAALVFIGAVWTPQAEGQNDNSGLSSQSPAPVTITPAPSNPSANTPTQSQFFPQSPQSNAPAVSGAARLEGRGALRTLLGSRTRLWPHTRRRHRGSTDLRCPGILRVNADHGSPKLLYRFFI